MKSTVIVLSNKGMGTAPQELGSILISNYLKLLSEENELPQTLLFYAEGVKLVCQDSPVLESLQIIEQKGAKLIVCKTCLNFFGLSEQQAVGRAGTMADILTMQLEAKKVVAI
ncbi:MAG: DsrE family protein [Prolixibacteraceae bacterium]|jgi:selenium metabolism protein YedF|nr:DsrE family protein [Prolixibacteraceae bacterium]